MAVVIVRSPGISSSALRFNPIIWLVFIKLI